MEKLFENELLEDLYEARGEELENEYENKYGIPAEKRKVNNAEDRFTDSLVDYIKDEEKLQSVVDDFENYKHYAINLSEFWRKQYYKLGFIDCLCLIKELLEILKFLENTDDKRNIKDFKHYEIILDFIGYLEYNQNPNAYSFPKDKLLMEYEESSLELNKRLYEFIDIHIEPEIIGELKKFILERDEIFSKVFNRMIILLANNKK